MPLLCSLISRQIMCRGTSLGAAESHGGPLHHLPWERDCEIAWIGQTRAAAVRVASAPVQPDLDSLNHPV